MRGRHVALRIRLSYRRGYKELDHFRLIADLRCILNPHPMPQASLRGPISTITRIQGVPPPDFVLGINYMIWARTPGYTILASAKFSS